MVKSSKETTKADPADPLQTALHQLQESGLGSLTWMGTAWTEAMAQMGSEMISFMADRIQEDVKAQHEILQCKTLAELQAAQAAFLERAYVQYTVETGKLIKMGTEIFPPLPTETKATPL
ncbi:phasin family protein [Yoonia sp.]|uniref:phasin family protein n=1 Tax=Yoonia sp. TaxID=2212373 RepID=UPI0019DDC9B9|nr:phasin family protein [Yoonia sp.]MBE0413997.1 phasin family protein [Yoonia sp.]